MNWQKKISRIALSLLNGSYNMLSELRIYELSGFVGSLCSPSGAVYALWLAASSYGLPLPRPHQFLRRDAA